MLVLYEGLGAELPAAGRENIMLRAANGLVLFLSLPKVARFHVICENLKIGNLS